ncbi:MAG: LysR family transcriptional regulator [Gammaproteobacteria bacterium]
MEQLTDIAVFCQVVELASFTRAAAKLELSRAVVSKYLSRLEQRLGVQLLNRTTRRLSLTQAGSALYEKSARALADIAGAELEVTRFQSEPRGVLKVNAPMTFGILHITPGLPDFLARYPEVGIDLRLDDRLIDPVAEGFDLTIRIGLLDDSALIAKRLARCRQVVCAAPAYLARFGAPTVPDDLRAHHCLNYAAQATPKLWQFKDRTGAAMAVPARGRLQTNNGLALRAAALAGLGIVLLPTFYVGEDLQAGRLRALLPDYPLPEFAIYALYAERRHLAPKVRAFIDFLAERYAPEPYWDRGAPRQ